MVNGLYAEAELEFSLIMVGFLLLRLCFYIAKERRNGSCSTAVVWALWLAGMVPASAVIILLWRFSFLSQVFVIVFACAGIFLPVQLCGSLRNAGHRRKEWICMAIYAAFILCITFFGRIGREYNTKIYIWLFTDMLNDTADKPSVMLHYLLNVLLFVPMGFLYERINPEHRKGVLPAIVFGGLLSAVIESVQLLFSVGICDITDLFCNAAGVAAGAGLAYVWQWGRTNAERRDSL